MACEMTGSFSLIIPLLFVNTLIIILSHSFAIYRNQAVDRFHSPIYLKGIPPFILSRIPVNRIYKPYSNLLTIDEKTPISELKTIMSNPSFIFPIPVTDKNKKIVGMLPMGRIMQFVYKTDYQNTSVMEIAYPPVYCYEDDNLYQAVLIFSKSNLSRLPILSRASGQVIGLLQYQDIFNVYDNVPVDEFTSQ